MGYSLPGSSIHGISQARILEWVAISFSRGSSQPRDQICVSCIGKWVLYHWVTREAQCLRHSKWWTKLTACVPVQQWKDWVREWLGALILTGRYSQNMFELSLRSKTLGIRQQHVKSHGSMTLQDKLRKQFYMTEARVHVWFWPEKSLESHSVSLRSSSSLIFFILSSSVWYWHFKIWMW